MCPEDLASETTPGRGWGVGGTLNPVVLPQTPSRGPGFPSKASVVCLVEVWPLTLLLQHGLLSMKLPGVE